MTLITHRHARPHAPGNETNAGCHFGSECQVPQSGTLALSSVWHLALWHSALFGTWHFGTQLCLAPMRPVAPGTQSAEIRSLQSADQRFDVRQQSTCTDEPLHRLQVAVQRAIAAEWAD